MTEIPSQLPFRPNDKDDYIISTDLGTRVYPELLQPVSGGGVFIRPKVWTSFWITVKGELIPGEYEIAFTLKKIENAEYLASCVYKLVVIGAELPRIPLKYTCWFHYDCIADKHGYKIFSKRYYKVLNNYLKSAVSHGMNMLYTPLFTPALDTAVGGERTTAQLVDVISNEAEVYKFSFSRLKEFMDNALAKGIEYFEMSHLATQWGAKACPKVVAKRGGKTIKLFGWETPSQSESYLNFLDSFLSALKEFLCAGGYYEKCFFHISDEPSAEHLPNFMTIKKLLEKNMPGRPTIDALSHYELYKEDAVDIPVIATDSVKDFKENDALKWIYYCNAQRKGYLSNRFFNMPSERNRILGAQLYLHNIEGFLHWGFNFYNSVLSYEKINPYVITDAGGAFESGDSFLVYPNGDGVLESLRHEVFF